MRQFVSRTSNSDFQRSAPKSSGFHHQILPTNRDVQGHPSRKNADALNQEVPNALEVKPFQGEITNLVFWVSIWMLSQLVTSQVGHQRGVRQDVANTSRIREFLRTWKTLWKNYKKSLKVVFENAFTGRFFLRKLREEKG
ncbi:hypothetical protein MTR67_018234 [Solanum verrucosum]|uniref:Uncharacterized protein n=1 Tax=Solanum verrucosum TaxID=315347 RepID=A0AAF0TMI2_SOLVR|nr:hypothetical protein MTR67_018234 [Solanum verrucosum]